MNNADLWGLFVSSLLAATLLPGGSEIALTGLLVAGERHPGILLAVATVGNTLGGLSSWGIGRLAALGLHRFRPTSPGARRAEQWIQTYGGPVLLFSWVPVIGDPLCIAAGWLRVPFVAAFVFILLGKLLRYSVLVAVFS